MARARKPSAGKARAKRSSGRETAAAPVLTHFDERGQAWMVDVTVKPETTRTAVARGAVSMAAATLSRIDAGTMKKGDVLGIARLAGLQAVKRTADLIPLCHPVRVTGAELALVLDRRKKQVVITAKVTAHDRTGVEMEALTAVAAAALTVYDMCKAIDRGMQIAVVELVEKRGGRSGDYVR